MTQHTPGPWVWDHLVIGRKKMPCGLGIIDATGRIFAKIDAPRKQAPDLSWHDDPQWEATAHLIAAAPDYDAAARNLARLKDAGEPIPEEVWQQLYDAIAKAEGRS